MPRLLPADPLALWGFWQPSCPLVLPAMPAGRVQADYVRQLKLEMVDNIMEAGGHSVREPDDIKAAAADDPNSPPEMARRELDKIQEALDESMQELEGEMAEKDRRAAEESGAADKGGDAQ